jgi:hypothetical protein
MAEDNKSPKAQIVKDLAAAQQSLTLAYATAIAANPMAQDLQIFQDIKALGFKLADVMYQISKVRGL